MTNKDPHKQTRRLNIRLSEDEYQFIKTTAELEHMTMAGLLKFSLYNKNLPDIVEIPPELIKTLSQLSAAFRNTTTNLYKLSQVYDSSNFFSFDDSNIDDLKQKLQDYAAYSEQISKELKLIKAKLNQLK